MSKPLRVLIVEDSEDDTALLLRELQHGGYAPTFERVDTPEAMSAALDQQKWELVLADWSMPRFSGLTALDLLKDKGLDLPFIIVSGVIGEETAVVAMKAGAHDYLMKHNLKRLCPAIERELREVRERRARMRAEQALRESEARLQLVMEQLPAIIWITDTKLRITFVKGAGLQALTLDPNQLVGTTVLEHFQDDPERPPLTAHAVALRGEPCSFEMKIRERWLQAYIEPMRAPDGIVTGCLGIALDITARKQAEEGREKLILALQDALDNIKTLRGLLPICASCNKIRDSHGHWDHIESYIQAHTDANFTHSICPECTKKLYPQLG